MDTKSEATSERWLTEDYHPKKIESKIRDFWDENEIPSKLRELRKRENKGPYGYVEGPPTLNGYPHIGHVRGRIIKDLRYRYKTMQGYDVPFWGGWDTQGLPVELEVERELGVKNKKELLAKVGEEHFVNLCKEAIKKYYVEWVKADEKAGIFIDFDRSYWTYRDEYIEREWKYLKRAWEQNLLGEGYYIVAYCPSCQTSLSNAEVGLGYEEVEDPSIYFKLKSRRAENEYFIVWTTMPFTIVSDLMLAVYPTAEYARVEVNGEIWIMAANRVDAVMEELDITSYRVIDTFTGKNLEGVKYEFPFYDLVPTQRMLEKHSQVHSVISEDFVDVETATGVVHQSPGSGEEDFFAAQRRGVPIFAPYDDECKFTEEAGFFKGIFARDADDMVIEELRKRRLLLKSSIIRHEYPTCWRSHHKILWMARKEYFIWTDRMNQRILEAAGKVDYFYEGPKNRFFSFLKEGKPWCISRERTWGTPLPIWACEKCGAKTLVSSKTELLERAIEKPDGYFELHKPWIDLFILRCSRCGGRMLREPFVLDVWHNSGASPYARFTDEEFKKYVPTKFLVEAIDQTRGWANSLLITHIILTGKPEPPYLSFLFYGHVLDKNGRKMSKSLGNVIWANSLLDEQSVDISRFYLLWKCSPIESMNFDINEMNKRSYQVLSTFYHLNRFLFQNAEYDNFDPKIHTVEWTDNKGQLKPPERWLLSKLQSLVRSVTDHIENCEFNTALSELEEYIVNAISRQYIPMVRRDLWTDDPEYLNRRLAIYASLWHALKRVNLLLNPTTPYLCEFIHQHVYRRLNSTLPESVNFESWPTPEKTLVDSEIEEDVNVLIKCVSLVYSARQVGGMKRRWPLRKVWIIAPEDVQTSIRRLELFFLELSNVKDIEYSDDESILDSEARKYLAEASEMNIIVALDTRRDKSLIGEGLMRDLARRVQSLRKELGYVPTDILEAVYIAGLTMEDIELLKPFKDEMLILVRSKSIELYEEKTEIATEWHEMKLDKRRIYISIT